MYVYQCFKEHFVGTDGNLRAIYGIKCLEAGKDGVHTAVSLSSVTEDKEAVEKLVFMCNAGKLSPIHLLDVVEDEFG